MSDTPTPALRFVDVSVEYPRHGLGLDRVRLEIARGEFVFLIGHTGAGKSTLLKLVTREVHPTEGSVLMNGRDILDGPDWKVRREMGIVPQDFGLLSQKTVWGNLAYAMRAVGHNRRAVRKRVAEIMDQVGVGHRADALPHQLSGGEKQRVAIARALINNPPLLLADEPTGNLDPERSVEIMDLLAQLNRRGTTVVVASHDMHVIEKMDRRKVTLEGGRIVGDTGAEASVDR